MAKKPDRPVEDEDDELESIPVGIGPARGGAHALMSPINKGKCVHLRPSAATVEEMKRRGVTHVTCSWERSKKNGRVLQGTGAHVGSVPLSEVIRPGRKWLCGGCMTGLAHEKTPVDCGR
jgi:hypothetical protein